MNCTDYEISGVAVLLTTHDPGLIDQLADRRLLIRNGEIQGRINETVNWLRSRQEERELAYWLAFVAYEKSDHSLNNRIYLLYLILFFGVWVFVTMTFFASGGALLFNMIHPEDPVQAGILVEVLLLGTWSLYSTWRAMRRCPIIFSEEDGLLLSQTPISRPNIILRWLLMPWLKSAIPFWIVAVTLGFSLAEVTMPGAMGTNRIIEYLGFGIRAWLVIVPVHLILYGYHWILGVVRLSTRKKEQHWMWLMLVCLLMVWFIVAQSAFTQTPIFSDILISLTLGFEATFHWLLWLQIWMGALLVLAFLYLASWNFSLNRAVQQTSKEELISTAKQYGLSQVAEQEKTQSHLGVERRPSRIPALEGPGILLWKDLLQSQRTFRLTSVFKWLQIFVLLFILPALPDLGSRGLVIILWIIQLGQISVQRIRSDLEVWTVIRQLPISTRKFLLYDFGLSYSLAMLISLAGFLLGGATFGVQMPGLALLLPGMMAAIFSAAAFDVIRRSNSGLLLSGSVPELSAGGILLGILIAGIPLVLLVAIPTGLGMMFALILSLGLAYLAFELAVSAFRHMDHA